jgi:hypothetical protein
MEKIPQENNNNEFLTESEKRSLIERSEVLFKRVKSDPLSEQNSGHDYLAHFLNNTATMINPDMVKIILDDPEGHQTIDEIQKHLEALESFFIMKAENPELFEKIKNNDPEIAVEFENILQDTSGSQSELILKKIKDLAND